MSIHIGLHNPTHATANTVNGKNGPFSVLWLHFKGGDPVPVFLPVGAAQPVADAFNAAVAEPTDAERNPE